MTKNVVLFNAPPGAGKDFICEALVREVGGQVIKFAAPIKRAVPTIYNISPQRWNVLDSLPAKDLPCEELYGRSPREVQIAVSEQLLKPLHGENVFGKIAVQALRQSNARNVFFSDCGFRAEVDEIIDYCRSVGHKIVMVRIKREGCNFSKDSRGYVFTNKCVSFDVTNKGDYSFVQEVRAALFGAHKERKAVRYSQTLITQETKNEGLLARIEKN